MQIQFGYFQNSQAYMTRVNERDKLEKDSHLVELIRQAKVDDAEQFRQLQNEIAKLKKQLDEANRSKQSFYIKSNQLEEEIKINTNSA